MKIRTMIQHEKAMKERLKKAAKKRGLSLSGLINVVMTMWLSGEIK